MPPPTTASNLLELIRKGGLLTADQLTELKAKLGDLPEDPAKAATQLVRGGWITTFQARLLLAGRYRGFRLGAYIVREQIGQGGMGAVYLAHHQTLRRPVAIKVLAPNSGVNKLAVERFLREARAAAALDHPNIVRLIDVGKQDDTHYLVMEYVEGQTLDKVIENTGALAAGRAVEYITQAAAGLQHAHEKGFVHRDIKPGNLILSKEGIIKILDMGLARPSDGGEKLTEVLDKGAVVGTADYISPEQAMNNPNLDIRSDIYSLGATMFTLITGRTLYEGNTTQKLLQHQMKAPPSLATLDKTVPSGLAQVVERMLAKNPDDRPQTPADVIAELVPWLTSNHKVIAGLSQTNLNSSAKLRKSLETAVNKSSADFELPEARASEGKSRTAVRRQASSAKRPSKLPLMLGLGLGLLLLLGLGGAAVAYFAGLFGSSKVPTMTDGPQPSNPVPLTLPTDSASPPSPATGSPASSSPPTTSPATAKLPEIVPPVVGIVYELELGNAAPLAEKGSSAGFGQPWQSKIKAGSGSIPPDWKPSTENNQSEAEIVVESVAGSVGLGLRNTGGPPAAQLASPEFPISAPELLLTVEYTSDTSGPVGVQFRPTGADKPLLLGSLPPIQGVWTRKELTFSITGPSGRIEFVHRHPKGTFWLRGFQVREPSYTPSGKVLWAMNFSRQMPFIQRAAADPGAAVPVKILKEVGSGKMPSGWYRWVEFSDSEVEFFADGPPGKLAFGVRTVTGTPGVMATLPEFRTPSSRATVRLVYQAGQPGAVLRWRPTQPKRMPVIEVAKLTPTGAAWKMLTVEFSAPGSTGGLFELYNTAAGPEGAVRIRELVVTDKASPPAE